MELKDVIQLYLGCECHIMGEHVDPYVDNPVPKVFYIQSVSLDEDRKTIYVDCYSTTSDECVEASPVDVFPLLRPLSSMTEEHRKELFKIVFKREFPDSGQTIFYDKRTTLQEPRWVLSSGCDRLGIQFNGDIWADCDLHPFKQNPHLLTLKLCEWGYDIFFLIPEGKAIDATTLTQQQ